MEVRNAEDCFRFRLLRRIAPDVEKSRKSLEISAKRLEEAAMLLKQGFFDFAAVNAYMAMFHASRALLYKDGVQEKSHFAISIYLKEKYRNRISSNILSLLDIHRVERHEAMYGLEYKPQKHDAEAAISDAKLFVREIKGVL